MFSRKDQKNIERIKCGLRRSTALFAAMAVMLSFFVFSPAAGKSKAYAEEISENEAYAEDVPEYSADGQEDGKTPEVSESDVIEKPVNAGVDTVNGETEELPVISIRKCPGYGVDGFIIGSVYYPDSDKEYTYGKYRIACYIRVAGTYYVKPTYEKPYVIPDANGNFSFRYNTSGEDGHDPEATEIVLYLVPGEHVPARSIYETEGYLESIGYLGTKVTVTRPTDGSAVTVEPSYPIHYSTNYHNKGSGLVKEGCKVPFCMGLFPKKANGSAITDNEIRDQITVIEPYTYALRFYSSSESGKNAYAIAKNEFGLQVVGTAFLSADNSKNEREINAIISLANQGLVDVVLVGNEVLLRGEMTADKLNSYIDRVRAGITRPDVAISYAETYNVLLENPTVADNCDFLAPHIYPFYTGKDISEAEGYFRNALDEIRLFDPNKEFVVFETGWPAGPNNYAYGSAICSIENSIEYFNMVQRVSKEYGIISFIFEAHDENWKSTVRNAKPFDREWGILDEDLQPKGAFAEVLAGLLLITVDKDTITLVPRQTDTVTAVINTDDPDAHAVWWSSDESVATVSDGVVTGVSPGTATIYAGYEDDFATVQVTVKDPTPVVPRVSASADIIERSVALSWIDEDDADSYNVYRAEAPEGDYTLLATVSDAFYTDNGLESGKTYFYKVSAYARVYEVDYTSDMSAACPAVIGDILSLTGTTDNTNTLSWLTVPGSECYDVLRSEDGENYNVIASVSSDEGPGYMDDSLGYNTEYFYKIAAHDENYSFAFESNAVNSVTALVTPVLTAAPASYNSVKLTWYKVDGANGYEIYRAVGDEAPVLIKTVGGGAVTFTNTGLQCGTEYKYYIRAYKTVNKVKTYSADSNTAEATPVPATPARPAASTVVKDGVSAVKLTWSAVAGANGYEVERSGSIDGDYEKIAETGVKPLLYNDGNVSAGNKYFYRVKAYRLVNGDRIYGGESPAISVTVSLLAPTVSIVSSTFNSAKIGWDKVTGATGYEVWRSDDGGEFAMIADIKKGSTVAYNNTKLTPGVQYSYKVIAYYKSKTETNRSGDSNIVEVTPEIDAPKTFKVARSGNNLKVTWSAVGGASGYELYRSVNGKDFVLIAETTAKVKAYTDTNVNRGVQYSYKVRAIAPTATGRYSQVVTATPMLAAPGGFSAKATNFDTITLKWSKSAGATGYAVYRSKTKNGTYYRIGSTDGNTAVTYTDTGLDTGVTYYYVIKAMRKQGGTTGYSQCSAIKSAKTALKAPTKPASVKLNGNTARLSWTAAPGADGYVIYRKAPGSKTFEEYAETTDTTYDDTGLEAKNTYQYKIMAYRVNSDGERAYSPFTGVIKRAM